MSRNTKNPAARAEALRLHGEGEPIRAIAEKTGLSRSSVHRLIVKGTVGTTAAIPAPETLEGVDWEKERDSAIIGLRQAVAGGSVTAARALGQLANQAIADRYRTECEALHAPAGMVFEAYKSTQLALWWGKRDGFRLAFPAYEGKLDRERAQAFLDDVLDRTIEHLNLLAKGDPARGLRYDAEQVKTAYDKWFRQSKETNDENI